MCAYKSTDIMLHIYEDWNFMRYGEDEGGYVVTVSFIGHPLRKETILILRKCVSCKHIQTKLLKLFLVYSLDKKIKKCTTIEKNSLLYIPRFSMAINFMFFTKTGKLQTFYLQKYWSCQRTKKLYSKIAEYYQNMKIIPTNI